MTADTTAPAVHRHLVLTSTNDEALRLAASGAPAGTAVVAEEQTAGRGRAGHSWNSPPGVALLFSVVLRPALPPERLPLVPLACGCAISRAVVDFTALPARVKWPNDILVNGRKCAGLLCEAASGAVVCGVGVNVNTPPEALPPRPIFPASSLLAESGASSPFDREALLSAMLDALPKAVSRLEEPDGPDWLAREFAARDALRGRAVKVALPDGSTATGVASGIAPSGALLLADVGQGLGGGAAGDGSAVVFREIFAGSVSL